MLAGLKRVANHGEMQSVGGAHVDGIHGGICQDLAIVRVGLVDVEFLAKLAGFFRAALADGIHVDETEAANAFQVDAAHETGAENCGSETVHDGL